MCRIPTCLQVYICNTTASRYIPQIYDPSLRSEKFATDKPRALWARGVFSGKLLMTEDEGRIFVEYTIVAVVHMIYTRDITLGYRGDYLTMKTTYNYVLYFIVDSWAWFALALADLKVTMVSHVINKFKFQQAIHKIEEFVPL